MQRETVVNASSRWGANFDGVDVDPFLRHVASHIESGFGEAEARTTARKIRRLWPGCKAKFAFEVRVAGSLAPLRIRASWDDIDAFLISFQAPPALCEVMAKERARIEAELVAATTAGATEADRPLHNQPLQRTGAAVWLYRLLGVFFRGPGR